MANRKRPRSQWCVGKPSHVGSVTRSVEPVGAHQAEVEKQSTKSGHPETESIQARKSHVPRTNHEWDQVVYKSEHNRHDHEEDHGRSVHGEHSIEDMGRNKVIVGTDQLNSDDDRFDAGDHEKQQSINDV